MQREGNLKAIAEFAREGIDLFEHWRERSLTPFFDGDTGDRMMALGFEMDSGEAFVSVYGCDAFDSAIELDVAARRALDLDALGSGIFTRWRVASRSDFHPATEEESAWFLAAFRLLEAAAEMEIPTAEPATGSSGSRRSTCLETQP